MTEIATPAPSRSTPGNDRWHTFLDVAGGLFWNPIIEKEILARMRSWRAPVAISAFIFILSLVGWVALAIASAASNFGGSAVTPGIGLGMFAALMVTELVLVILLTPGLTAGAISGEKERQTLDLLLCTRVRPSAIVAGKLMSSVLFILLQVLVSVPLLCFVFLFGGVELDQVLVTTLVLMLTALAVGSIGIFCSSVLRNSIASTASAFLLTVIFLVGPAILPYFITAVTNPRSFSFIQGQPIYQLGEPFFALGATLAPASANNNNFSAQPTIGLGSSVGGTICTSTPNGGTQCRTSGNGGRSTVYTTGQGNISQPTLPLGNVMLQGDTVVAGPLQHWHAWQIFSVLNLAFAAILLFFSTLLLGPARLKRAQGALRPPRHAELPPLGVPSDAALPAPRQDPYGRG